MRLHQEIRLTLTALITVFIITAADGYAADYYVDANATGAVTGADWTNAFLSIQAGIDACSGTSADTVHVAEATYFENIVLQSYVELLGGYPAAGAGARDPSTYETIIDGRASDSVIRIDTKEYVVVDGFTITNGDSSDGGGIYCYDCSPTISNNALVQNYADRGGAISSESGSPTIENNTISNNDSDQGGGIFYEEGSPIIRNNIFTQNETGDGGGVSCLYGSGIIIGNLIEGNLARLWGGGISCEESSPTIEDNVITGNSSLWMGGGISCEFDSYPVIRNNTISGNYATEGDGGGGGIFVWYYSSPTIVDNIISDNSAGWEGGGGICFWDWCDTPVVSGNKIYGNYAGEQGGGGIGVFYQTTPTITDNEIYGNSTCSSGGGITCYYNVAPTIANNLIAGNSAGNLGGGICCSDDSPSIITNNTVADNTAAEGGGISSEDSSPVITDCIIWGNGDDLYGCSGTYCCIEDEDTGDENIHSNPMFVSGAFGDYYLDPASSCIDAGSVTAIAAGLSEDVTTQTSNALDTGDVDLGYHYPLVEGNTPTGTDVEVTDSESGTTVTLAEVTTRGNTTVTVTDTGPTPPGGYSLLSSYYEISTTAEYTGPITICIQYDDTGLSQEEEDALTLRHYEDSSETWGDVTSSLDTTDNVICGETEHFSFFAVFSRDVISADIDINPNKINLKSKGNYITCYIELPTGYDVNDIDVSTVILTANGSELQAESSPTDVGDYDLDGTPGLMIKFDRQAVHDIVSAGSVEFAVAGSLDDGTCFEGTDVVTVMDQGKEHTDEDDHSSIEE